MRSADTDLKILALLPQHVCPVIDIIPFKYGPNNVKGLSVKIRKIGLATRPGLSSVERKLAGPKGFEPSISCVTGRRFKPAKL